MSQKKIVKADPAADDSADYESDNTESAPSMQYLLNSPAYMSAVMRRQLLLEMFKKLPAPVQGRVHAIKNIQLEQIHLEAKFYEEVYLLEKKYQKLYQPLQDKRAAILAGSYEPTEKEVVPLPGTIVDENDEDGELSNKMNEVSIEIRKHLKTVYPADVKGVPDFWLTIFRSTDLLSSMIQPHDEEVLKQLNDVRVVYADDMSYTLEFQFAENAYFSNAVLTKVYHLKSKVEAEEPFTFEGPEIYRCEGCTIQWKEGKNLTVKVVKKKQKHKSRGAVRMVEHNVPQDSFFNFFNPPQQTENEDEEEDEDTASILSTDYEIGHFLRARIVPKAVLYYTGDVMDEEDEDEYDEEEEEEEDDEDEEEDDDDDVPPPRSGKGGKHHGGGGGKAGPKDQPAECKQQ